MLLLLYIYIYHTIYKLIYNMFMAYAIVKEGLDGPWALGLEHVSFMLWVGRVVGASVGVRAGHHQSICIVWRKMCLKLWYRRVFGMCWNPKCVYSQVNGLSNRGQMEVTKEGVHISILSPLNIASANPGTTLRYIHNH